MHPGHTERRNVEPEESQSGEDREGHEGHQIHWHSLYAHELLHDRAAGLTGRATRGQEIQADEDERAGPCDAGNDVDEAREQEE
jgi:hypothetical protein